jgi:hypothetical protein
MQCEVRCAAAILPSLFAMQRGGHGSQFASLLSVPGLDVDVKRSVWLTAEMFQCRSKQFAVCRGPRAYEHGIIESGRHANSNRIEAFHHETQTLLTEPPGGHSVVS